MAIVRFAGFNEGSLLRRTLVHVVSFVVGSLAVVTLLSFALVSLAKGLLPAHGASSAKGGDDEAAAAAADDGVAAAPVKAGIKPRKARNKGLSASGAPGQAPAVDE